MTIKFQILNNNPMIYIQNGHRLNIFSWCHSCECRNLLIPPEEIPELRFTSSGMTEKFN